jgi:hypothetical protein
VTACPKAFGQEYGMTAPSTSCCFRSIDGGKIAHLGERNVKFEVEDECGKSLMASMRFEVAGVQRAVVSVGGLVAKGFDVSFDGNGGWISKDGRRVPLIKRGNRYFLRVKWRQAGGALLEVAPLEEAQPATPRRHQPQNANQDIGDDEMDRIFEDFDQDTEEEEAREEQEAAEQPEEINEELLGRPEVPGPVASAPMTPHMPSEDKIRAHI